MDYLDPAIPRDSGASGLVVADGLIYWSGILAAKSDGDEVVIPAYDMNGQLRFILNVIERMLVKSGSDHFHILSMTMFTRDVKALGINMNAFADGDGGERPAGPVIGVCGLQS